MGELARRVPRTIDGGNSQINLLDRVFLLLRGTESQGVFEGQDGKWLGDDLPGAQDDDGTADEDWNSVFQEGLLEG